jgi:hypothetical protein
MIERDQLCLYPIECNFASSPFNISLSRPFFVSVLDILSAYAERNFRNPVEVLCGFLPDDV